LSRWFGSAGFRRLKPCRRQSTVTPVNIDLPGSVEEQLRSLAARQGRDVRTLVEEAIRQYLESAAITDLDATQVAEAQVALLGELPDVSDWKAEDA
jgi:predicted DNA-binding protein